MKCTCFSSLSKLLVVQWWRSSKIIILLSSFGTWNHQISSTLPLPKTSCENHDCIPMLPLQLDRKIVYIPWFGRKLNRFLSILINWELFETNYPNFEFSTIFQLESPFLLLNLTMNHLFICLAAPYDGTLVIELHCCLWFMVQVFFFSRPRDQHSGICNVPIESRAA